MAEKSRSKFMRQRFIKSILRAPSMLKAPSRSADVFSKTTAPLGHHQALAKVFNLFRVPLVSALLFLGCPSAVFRFVVAIWVNAVNRVGGARLLTHIGKKVFKRIHPSIAHSNSDATINSIPPQFWIGASCLHCGPGAVRTGSVAACPTLNGWSGMAMSRDNLLLQAPATQVLAHPKIASSCNRFPPAFTKAPPHRLWAWMRDALNNIQSPKFFAGEVYKCAHV